MWQRKLGIMRSNAEHWDENECEIKLVTMFHVVTRESRSAWRKKACQRQVNKGVWNV